MGVGVGVMVMQPVMVRLTVLDVVTGMPSAIMANWLAIGPGQLTAPHQRMGLSNEYMVAGNAAGDFQTKSGGPEEGEMLEPP